MRNATFANGPDTFVNQPILQSTLREMRTAFTHPPALIAMAGIGLALGLVGPFQTYEALPVGPRLAYWLAMAVVTFAVARFFGAVAQMALERQGWPVWALVLVGGLAAGLPVSAAVIGLNWMWFGTVDLDGFGLVEVPVYCTAIAIIVTLVLQTLQHRPGQAASPQAAPRPVAPRILDRLPADKRGALIALSATDHYVEVTTSRGRELVLMRLADAIAETQGVAGWQIHRSHWVARDGVAGTERRDGKPYVLTTSGLVLPVSRTYMPALRDIEARR